MYNGASPRSRRASSWFPMAQPWRMLQTRSASGGCARTLSETQKNLYAIADQDRMTLEPPAQGCTQSEAEEHHSGSGHFRTDLGRPCADALLYQLCAPSHHLMLPALHHACACQCMVHYLHACLQGTTGPALRHRLQCRLLRRHARRRARTSASPSLAACTASPTPFGPPCPRLSSSLTRQPPSTLCATAMQTPSTHAPPHVPCSLMTCTLHACLCALPRP